MSARTALPESAAEKWRMACSTANRRSTKIDDVAADSSSTAANVAKPASTLGKIMGGCKTAPWQRQVPPWRPESESRGRSLFESETGEGQQQSSSRQSLAAKSVPQAVATRPRHR